MYSDDICVITSTKRRPIKGHLFQAANHNALLHIKGSFVTWLGQSHVWSAAKCWQRVWMFITESKAGVSEDVRLRCWRNQRDFRPTEWHLPSLSAEKRPVILLAASQFRGWIIQRPNALARQRLSQFEGSIKWGLQMHPPFPGPRRIERDPSQPIPRFIASHCFFGTDSSDISDWWWLSCRDRSLANLPVTNYRNRNVNPQRKNVTHCSLTLLRSPGHL